MALLREREGPGAGVVFAEILGRFRHCCRTFQMTLYGSTAVMATGQSSRITAAVARANQSDL